MAAPDTLTSKQERVILALLTSPTIDEAAKSSDTGKRTLYRWLKEPAFIAAFRRARASTVDHAISRLQQASSKAVNALTKIMEDEDAAVAARVTAATKILEMAIRGTELAELHRRLEELEQARGLPALPPEDPSIVSPD